jgi:hypothetical protein
MAININPGTPIRHVATYTSSGTFTPPAGVTTAFVSMHSATGGGGGAAGQDNGNGGGQGGLGLVVGSFVEVIPGVACTVTIGAAGALGVSNVGRYNSPRAASGGTGGTTSFDGNFFVTGSVGGQGGVGRDQGNTVGDAGAALTSGAATGTTTLTSLSPASAVTRVKGISTQASGASVGGTGASQANNRYSQGTSAATVGLAGIVHVYI